VKADEITVLARGACMHWAPKNTNSRLVSISSRLVARDTGAKIALAYSDTDAGEIGSIYQSCNWFYIGMTTSSDVQFVAPNGRAYHSKIRYDMCRKAGIVNRQKPQAKARKMLLDAGWTEQRVNPKHKYVCILDRGDSDLRTRIERMAKPYPKRATSETNDTANNQLAEGGAAPTVALQIEKVDKAVAA
jgi:hypothetical protein